jgi:hypothetical protein
MLQSLTRVSFLTVLTIFLWFPSTALADGFTLTEIAPPGREFSLVVVTWTDKDKKPLEGVSTAMTRRGLNAEEQIQRTLDHLDPESGGSRTNG